MINLDVRGDKTLHNIIRYIDAHPDSPAPYDDALSLIREHIIGGNDPNALILSDPSWHAVNKAFRGEIATTMRRLSADGKDVSLISRFNDVYYRSLLIDAPVSLDAYIMYIEKNRPLKKRFYVPRRDKLLKVVNILQDLEDDKYDIAGISLPPGVGKTTTAIFYLTWLAGRHPDEPMLTGSHSNAFIRGVYDECLRIFDKNGEYLWHDVFPGIGVVSTNAKDCRIDLGKRKRFETLEFTSIGTGNAGLYRASRLLYCDDLVSGLEVALSRERLDKLWETYTTDLRQRKIGDHCKELHVATHWSTGDPVARLERQYADDPRAIFLAIPALNEDDESNFDYKYGVGFTTEFYKEQREIMDDISWRALYMNQPIEREGLLYSANELRRYFELPAREPDAIIAVCDTKDRGTDYCVMPIAYQYGQDYYIEDVVCDNSNPEIVEPRLASKCIEHKIHMARFESNSAGGRVAQSIQEAVKQRGGITRITTKYTTQNKETKIIMASPFVKEHFLFKDDSVTKDDKEYRRFMNFVCSYTMTGKNKWDDCVDGLAMLADYVQTFTASQVEVMRRPF